MLKQISLWGYISTFKTQHQLLFFFSPPACTEGQRILEGTSQSTEDPELYRDGMAQPRSRQATAGGAQALGQSSPEFA